MQAFFWNIIFGLLAIVLSGILILFIHFVYFSNWGRAYGIVAIFFAVIVYSNFLAQTYLHTHKHIGLHHDTSRE